MNSGGASTIFNARRDISSAQLTNQMQSGMLGRANEKATVIQAEYDSKIQKNDFVKERWEQHKKLVEEASDIVSNNYTRLEGLYSTLDSMLNTINASEQAQNDPDNSFIPDGYAATFDSQFRSLYNSANESRTTNLLNSDTREIDYPISFNGVLSKIIGADVRPDYYIEDSDGKHWQLEADTKLLRKYDSYPNDVTDPGEVSTFSSPDSLVLNSLTGDAISMTVSANTANAKTVTGTLKREGTEVLNAWLYDNFTTSDGRDRARDDIKSAMEVIFLEKSRYEMVKTTLNYHDEVSTAEIRNLRDKSLALQAEGQREVADMQDRVVREYQAAQSALAVKFSQKASLSALIPKSSVSSPIMQILMDINA
jgi:hypothetical protein